MTKREFFKKIANEKHDLLQEFINVLRSKKIPFCVIGGLGVNAYAEPVVSLDLDVVVVVDRLKEVLSTLPRGCGVKRFKNSINITSRDSDLRIQLQTDPRYQNFIKQAKPKEVLGYKIPVARIEDVLQGKIWAVQDKTRRPSKRQKDLADIMRLIEVKKGLILLVSDELKQRLAL